ncbi:AraC family transcriptional regulator [Paenibacillus swuensis]|nr:AraC family transcriptional regulator [Paenibacillus swuensis]
MNRVRESFDMLEHAHDFVEISYVSEGAGTHYIGDQSMEVRRGDLFFIPIGISHVFRPASVRDDRPLVVYNCIFQASVLEDLLSAPGIDDKVTSWFQTHALSQNILRMRDHHEEAHRVMQEMYGEFTRRDIGFLAALYRGIIQLFILMFRKQHNHSPVPQTLHNGLEDLMRNIRLNGSSAPGLEEACTALGIGERQFSRLFKRHTGKTYIQYVQNARIEHSLRLLTGSNLSVREIAWKCGYQDIKFFNALFKKHTGMTPRAYRSSFLNLN